MLLRQLWVTFLLVGLGLLAQPTNSKAQKVSLNFIPATNKVEVEHILEIPFAADSPQPMIQLQLPESEKQEDKARPFSYKFNHIEVNGSVLDAFFLAEPIPSGATMAIRLQQPLFPGEWFQLKMRYELSLPESDALGIPGQGKDHVFLPSWLAQLSTNVPDVKPIYPVQVSVTMPTGWTLLTPGFLQAHTANADAGTWSIEGFAQYVPLVFLKAWPQRLTAAKLADGSSVDVRWLVSSSEFDVELLTQQLASLLEQQGLHKYYPKMHGLVLPAIHQETQERLREAGFLVYSADTSIDAEAELSDEIITPLSAYLWQAPGRIDPEFAAEWQAFWTQSALQQPLLATQIQMDPFLLRLLAPELGTDTSWQTRVADLGTFLSRQYSQDRPRAALERHGLGLLSMQRNMPESEFTAWIHGLQVTKQERSDYLSTAGQQSGTKAAAWMPFLESFLELKAQSFSLENWQQVGAILELSFKQQGMNGTVVELAIFFEDGTKQIAKVQVSEARPVIQVEAQGQVEGLVIDPEFKLPALQNLDRVHTLQVFDDQSRMQQNLQRSSHLQHVMQWLLGGL